MDIKNKRIMVFIWQDWWHPRAGGAEAYCKAVTQALSQAGAKVRIICCTVPDQPKSVSDSGITIERIAPRSLIVPATFFWYLKNQNDIDLTIDFTNKIPYLAPLYVKKPLVAAFMHTNGITFLDEWGILGWLGIWAESLTLLPYRTHPAVAISESTAEELRGRGFRNVRVGIVPTAWAKPERAKPAKQPFIAVTSRLRKYKRLDLLFRATAIIRKKVPVIKIAIVGRGPDEGRLKNMVKQLELDDTVGFYGFLPDDKRDQLLQKSWLTVLTSRKEGWGITIIEAAQFAVPTIGIDAPGTRDAIVDKETGILIKEDTPEALARAILELVSNPVDRQKLGRAAKARARLLTFDKMRRVWLKTIVEELKGKSDQKIK